MTAKVKGLNQTELFVLLALPRLEQAYGVSVRDEIERRAGREFSITAVYAALDRLEQYGYARSQLSEPLPERGGRARKHFSITAAGLAALQSEREALARMWEGLEPGRAG
jgi:DNA-binding PadR family transcriptional regulator